VSRRRQRRRVEPTEDWGQLDTRFKSDLAQPGLRIPFTADGETFGTAAELRRTEIWLHTFGERFADSRRG
jgi:Type ISP C-terminal specificity domain